MRQLKIMRPTLLAAALAPAMLLMTPAGAQSTEGDEASQQRFVVDAMVGQIERRPIFASEVFERIGAERLATLGQDLPRGAFQHQVAALIGEHLRGFLMDELVKREAQQELTAQQQQGLEYQMRVEREKMIARWGAGSEAVAEDALRREEGLSLQEALDERRQEMVIRSYQMKRFAHKLNVTRREVEQYYQDNYDKYNAPPTVTLRIIIVPLADEATADAVEKGLAAGEDFAELAGRYSRFRRSDQGALSPMQLDGPLSEFDDLGWDAVNEAVRELKVGEHTPRVRTPAGYIWARLEKVEGGEQRTLAEAYSDIEQDLKNRKYVVLMRRHRAELINGSSHTPIDQMLIELVEVAMNRFAQPQ